MNNDKKPRPARDPQSESSSEGQSGAQSGNHGMKQKPGAAPKGVNADANDDSLAQSGAETHKSVAKDLKAHDPARDEVD